jgi:hypothetical protein
LLDLFALLPRCQTLRAWLAREWDGSADRWIFPPVIASLLALWLLGRLPVQSALVRSAPFGAWALLRTGGPLTGWRERLIGRASQSGTRRSLTESATLVTPERPRLAQASRPDFPLCFAQ